MAASGSGAPAVSRPLRLDAIVAGLTTVVGATSLTAFIGASAALASTFVMASAALCAMLVALVPIVGFLLVVFVVAPMLFMAGMLLAFVWMAVACLWACTTTLAWVLVALRRR